MRWEGCGGDCIWDGAMGMEDYIVQKNTWFGWDWYNKSSLPCR